MNEPTSLTHPMLCESHVALPTPLYLEMLQAWVEKKRKLGAFSEEPPPPVQPLEEPEPEPVEDPIELALGEGEPPEWARETYKPVSAYAKERYPSSDDADSPDEKGPVNVPAAEEQEGPGEDR